MSHHSYYAHFLYTSPDTSLRVFEFIPPVPSAEEFQKGLLSSEPQPMAGQETAAVKSKTVTSDGGHRDGWFPLFRNVPQKALKPVPAAVTNIENSTALKTLEQKSAAPVRSYPRDIWGRSDNIQVTQQALEEGRRLDKSYRTKLARGKKQKTPNNKLPKTKGPKKDGICTIKRLEVKKPSRETV